MPVLCSGVSEYQLRNFSVELILKFGLRSVRHVKAAVYPVPLCSEHKRQHIHLHSLSVGEPRSRGTFLQDALKHIHVSLGLGILPRTVLK